MSRCYRISLKETISKTVSASDQMTHRVELQEGILGEEDMKDILRSSLLEEGWVEKEDGKFHLESEDGEDLVWDLEEKEVSASIKGETSFEKEVVVSGGGADDKQATEDAQKRMKVAKSQVDIDAEKIKNNLRKDITRQLEENEASRKKKLNRVVRKTYAEALKKKASLLGTIMSMDENQNGDDHQLTIRVLA